jgi:phage/plasmid-like protein (TIGR03299 family)
MPHNLATDSSNQTSMMYVGKAPWHGLGAGLNNPPTSEEAIRVAHLDWLVDKYPLQIETPLGYQTIRDQYAIMRTDWWKQGGVGPCFGIVSKEYHLLQNFEAFAFFDGIVGKKAAIYETAGALGDGERVWILAKLPETIRVVGDDICDKYLLLSNSHDGKSSVQMKFTPIRVVCQNTLTLALSQGPTIRVAHTRNMQDRMRQAESLLGIIHHQFDTIEQSFQRLSEVKMDDKKLDAYYKILFPNPKDAEDHKGMERARSDRKKATWYYEFGRGNQEKGVAGTLWAAYNGITKWCDYRETNQSPDQRLTSIWFGDGYLLKARAFRVAIENIRSWAA